MSRDVIDQWSRSLRVPRRRRRAITLELRSHLQEAQEELVRVGWNPEDAARESLHRLGDPAEIVEAFEQVYRPSRRKQLGLAFALATGMLLGVYGIGGSLASAKPTTTHRAMKHTAVTRGHRVPAQRP
ncbi:MAG TPA: permease prefix domain 1-containing protein [Chloroflexota bacterium]|jgi:hypothetical protein